MSNVDKQNADKHPQKADINPALIRRQRFSDRPLDLGLPPRAKRIELAKTQA